MQNRLKKLFPLLLLVSLLSSATAFSQEIPKCSFNVFRSLNRQRIILPDSLLQAVNANEKTINRSVSLFSRNMICGVTDFSDRRITISCIVDAHSGSLDLYFEFTDQGEIEKAALSMLWHDYMDLDDPGSKFCR